MAKRSALYGDGRPLSEKAQAVSRRIRCPPRQKQTRPTVDEEVREKVREAAQMPG
jgi:glutamine synthetase adenylyltransferase